jgi:aminoglycoside phosphotransferase (APT) family kinase protein
MEELRAGIRNPAVSVEGTIALASALDTCHWLEDQWADLEHACRPLPETLVHGDLVPKNARVRRNGEGPEFLAFDWETAGWGPPAADLARLADPRWSGQLRTYAKVLGGGVSVGTLRPAVQAGLIFRSIAAIRWASPKLAYEWPERSARRIGGYDEQLKDALGELIFHG